MGSVRLVLICSELGLNLITIDLRISYRNTNHDLRSLFSGILRSEVEVAETPLR